MNMRGAAATMRIPGLLCSGVLLCCTLWQAALAQPTLNFKRAVNNWPVMELYFSVDCAGRPALFTDKRYFSVHDNGVQVQDFDLWCFDPSGDECRSGSFALVFDASGSMAGAGNAGAKAAGNAFIDLLDGMTDEATILWFNSKVVVQQGMTYYLDLLHNAVNALPASGGTALWDGIYAGIRELDETGVNPCRAVIALTDGIDNSSTHSPADVISLAQRKRIKVFLVGLGSGIQSDTLKYIAEETGGKYYETPNPSQLKVVYEEIAYIIRSGFDNCTITYRPEPSCPDGAMRSVELSLNNYCGGSDTATRQYRALLDSSGFGTLHFGIGEATAKPDSDVAVPLLLLDTLQNGSLQAASFSVEFDPARLRFKHIVAPPASLLEGIGISANAVGGRVSFRTDIAKPVDVRTAPALVAELVFTAINTHSADTTIAAVGFHQWNFQAGCHKARTADGRIVVMPGGAQVLCTAHGPTVFCEGGSVRIEASPGFASYQWSSGDTGRTVTLRSAGSYTVTARDAKGRPATSAPVLVTVYPNPPTPLITRTVDVLVTQGAHTYQWYRDGLPLFWAKNSVLLIPGPGTYSVAAISEEGCSSMSAPFVVLVLPVAAVPAAAAFSIEVFPDPVKDDVTVVMNGMNGTDGKRVRISIFDASGRAVVADCEVDARSGNPMTISLKEQPSGLYFVIGTSGGATVVRKFMKIE